MNPSAKSAQSVLFQLDECNITFHVNRRAHAIMHSRCHFFKSVLGPETVEFSWRYNVLLRYLIVENYQSGHFFAEREHYLPEALLDTIW